MKTMQPRVVIDTNLFYYSVGISSDPRLRDDWVAVLEAQYGLSLASPTIIEVLTKADLDDNQVWACLDEMFSGRFADIVQIGFVPFDVAGAREVTASHDYSGLHSLRDEALRTKIACEADFLRFVALALIGGFLHAVVEDRCTGLSDEQAKSLLRHLEALLQSSIPFTLAAITDALASGYTRGDMRKAVDSCLNSLFASFAHVALMNLHKVVSGPRIGEIPEGSPGAQQKIVAAVQADPLYKQIKRADHPLAVLQKSRYKQSVDAYLAAMQSDFEAHALMPAEVLAFFINRLTGKLSSGAKYRKNDVFDLLLAFSIVADNTLFVSNDDDVIAALSTASPGSHALSKSLLR